MSSSSLSKLPTILNFEGATIRCISNIDTFLPLSYPAMRMHALLMPIIEKVFEAMDPKTQKLIVSYCDDFEVTVARFLSNATIRSFKPEKIKIAYGRYKRPLPPKLEFPIVTLSAIIPFNNSPVLLQVQSPYHVIRETNYDYDDGISCGSGTFFQTLPLGHHNFLFLPPIGKTSSATCLAPWILHFSIVELSL